MFIDRITIYAKAGNGGNGCVSFRREKYVAKGGPDGGDGGNGGNIIFRIDPGANTLLAFRYHRKFFAENGGDGKGAKWHGKNGADTEILVPRGTLIRDAASGRILKDMSDDAPYLCLCGGRGGWGNKHFATPTRQIPRFAKSGMKGEEAELLLELKMIADVGLLGLPNAGKSSLLSRISSARPKIADYPFTTLAPSLGVVETERGGFVCADIPGLIEGAGQGAGLGHDFLRHVDRCRLLLHLVDGSDMAATDPVQAAELINGELAVYSEELSRREQILVLNKCDTLLEAEKEEKLAALRAHFGCEVYPVSAVSGEGIEALLYHVIDRLAALPPITVYDEEQAPTQAPQDPMAYTVRRESGSGIFILEGAWLEKLVSNVNFEDRESLNYFERRLREAGVYERLGENGCKDGDTVSLYGIEFDFVE